VSAPRPLGWFGIVRLGLVQASLGAVVVLTTTTLNRVMVVELALPAVVPGALIAAHYAVQALRPRWGHGSDGTGRRTPWILGGMAALSAGGIGAALGVSVIPTAPALGLLLAALSYLAVGLGVGAAGTSLLTLAAMRVAPDRRPAAAAVIWIMMIAGFAVTAGTAGAFLDPFTMGRLVRVVGTVCATVLPLSALALLGLEGRAPVTAGPRGAAAPRIAFGAAVRQVWAEAPVRRFTLFVFTSMLAYGSQDLVLDPFAGRVLGLTPGDTTRLSGLQHGGALAGMLAVAVVGAIWGRRRPGFLRGCAVAGCALSALVLVGLACSGALGTAVPLHPAVATLGLGNGIFAVSAVGSMMALAGRGSPDRAGLRMGVWGAAQALAFGAGALLGPGLVEGGTALMRAPGPAYTAVFLVQALLFLLSARLVASAAPVGAADGACDADLVPVSA
jgi:BCD family chlorophyll transporter-like MFS transporter